MSLYFLFFKMEFKAWLFADEFSYIVMTTWSPAPGSLDPELRVCGCWMGAYQYLKDHAYV